MKLIYTVCANKREAQRIGKSLVRQRLAACVNIWPMESYYIWEGTFTQNREAVLLVKTSDRRLRSATQYINKTHSYEAPAVLVYTARPVNAPYSKWFNGILSKKKST